MFYFERPLGSDLTPVKFHPYTSCVLNRIVQVHCDTPELKESYRNSQKDFLDLFCEAGIKAHADNKIVFECLVHGIKIYYGFYDWVFSIGLSYYNEWEERCQKESSTRKP